MLALDRRHSRGALPRRQQTARPLGRQCEPPEQICSDGTVISSEIKHDKNGKAFRATRVTDEDGLLVNIMVWGTLAEADYLWQNGTVIEIMGAYINHTQVRLDLRNSSQALLSGKHAEFKRLRERFYEAWA